MQRDLKNYCGGYAVCACSRFECEVQEMTEAQASAGPAQASAGPAAPPAQASAQPAVPSPVPAAGQLVNFEYF